jgi:hypothetical protein
MFYEYAITTRKTRQPITKQHYEDYLSHLGDIDRHNYYDKASMKVIRKGGLGDVGNVNYEETKGLHVHYILKTDHPITSDNLYYYSPSKHGWNHKAVPIFNRSGWISYCEKDKIKKSEDNEPFKDQQIDMPLKKLF